MYVILQLKWEYDTLSSMHAGRFRGEDHMSAKTQIIHEKRKCIYEQTQSQKEYIFREDRCQRQAHPWDWEIYGDFHILQQNMAAESFC